MFWKILKSLLILFITIFFFLNPKSIYASYCTLQFFYKPTLVIATTENQTTNCSDYKTTIKFKKNFTIKGFSPNQFEIKTTYPHTWEICKNYINKPPVITVNEEPDPQFETGKQYLISIFPAKDLNSPIADLAVCNRTIFEVNGLYDPKVILQSLIIYAQPILMMILILPLLLFTHLTKYVPSLFSLILTSLIFFLLYGFLIYQLIKFIKKIIKKAKKA